MEKQFLQWHHSFKIENVVEQTECGLCLHKRSKYGTTQQLYRYPNLSFRNVSIRWVIYLQTTASSVPVYKNTVWKATEAMLY